MKNIRYIKSKLIKKSGMIDGVDLIESNSDMLLTLDLNDDDSVYDVQSILEKNEENDLSSLYELLDYIGYIGNGYDVVSADDIGQMSDAPCILHNVYTDDNGEYEFDDGYSVWYYADYQVTNCIEELLNTGEVLFTKL